MKLLYSNIIIYSAKDEYVSLRDLFKEENVFISEITRLEVLGFHSITTAQEEFFQAVFSILTVIPVTNTVIDRTIIFRKMYNLSVADSIISASAFIKNLTINTNNEEDFIRIKEIMLFNPIKKQK